MNNTGIYNDEDQPDAARKYLQDEYGRFKIPELRRLLQANLIAYPAVCSCSTRKRLYQRRIAHRKLCYAIQDRILSLPNNDDSISLSEKMHPARSLHIERFVGLPSPHALATAGRAISETCHCVPMQ